METVLAYITAKNIVIGSLMVIIAFLGKQLRYREKFIEKLLKIENNEVFVQALQNSTDVTRESIEKMEKLTNVAENLARREEDGGE